MASLLILKADVEDKIGSRMKMVFSGAMEAHLLAEEIGECKVAGSGISCQHFFRSRRRWCHSQPITTISYGLGSATHVSEDPKGLNGLELKYYV
jgi:hypothetical protein